MRILYCFIIATLSLFLMLQTAQAGSNATPVNPDRVEAEEVFSPNPRLTLEPVLLTEPLTIDGVIVSACFFMIHLIIFSIPQNLIYYAL